MCLLCKEFNAKRMTIYDVELALVEMSSILSKEHAAEIRSMITPILVPDISVADEIDISEDYLNGNYYLDGLGE